MIEKKEDPGFCGVSPFETGKWDIYWKLKVCPTHDAAFTQLKENLRKDNGLAVTGKFVRDSTSVFLKSIYGVVAYPAYLLLGGGIGLLRWTYLKATGENE